MSSDSNTYKEGDSVKSALKKKYPNLDVKVDYAKLLKEFELPEIKGETIILNPDNPTHRDWLEPEDVENEE
ncbi:hypothetical protein ACFOQM_13360 [Paenibacillus sp. GCM10012307]|uniref:Uncharacterized protein n=1 Tax=Paenibacillus roseus TaxID=2798579 RepID=A0A934J639_9BACL|nr:hypothetical protein [Paenibacillus roseus]MBJ6362283.1 hypothetical protein [Paenibacillus roseus]